MAALTLVVIAALAFGVEFATAEVASSVPAEESDVVKVAFYVPPPSPTLEQIAALQPVVPSPTRLPRATETRTRTPSPTRPPSTTATITRSPTAPLKVAMQAITRTATAAPTATATQAPPVVLNENYGLLDVLPPPDNRPVDQHADLNPSVRGYAPVSSTLALVDYTGDTDPGAPQLAGLFADNRTPNFTAAYQVYDWNWSCGCRGALLDDPEVTLVSIKTTPGEILRVPAAGAQIGNGFSVLVLYADADLVTLKYTRRDGAADGYTVHIQGITVDASLLALYRQANSAGRGQLPALRAGQAFAKAKPNDIRLAIRDVGTFMDPRSRKDWWRGH